MLCCQLLEHLSTLVPESPPELAPDSSGRNSVEPRLPEKHLAEQHHPAPEPAGPELVPPESAAVAVAEPVAVTSAKAAASVLVESGAVVAAIDDAAAETVRKCFENGLSVGDIQTEDNSAVDKPAEDKLAANRPVEYTLGEDTSAANRLEKSVRSESSYGLNRENHRNSRGNQRQPLRPTWLRIH